MTSVDFQFASPEYSVLRFSQTLSQTLSQALKLTALVIPLWLLGCGDGDDIVADQAQEADQAREKGVVIKAANAQLRAKSGSDISGTVSFRLDPGKDAMRIKLEANGLEPGKHGFHVHENGSCSGEGAKGAGGHFNPANRKHGAPTNADHHAGDLGNVVVESGGTVSVEVESPALTFTGESSIIGKSIVIHAKADDFYSQPSGDAGKRVACGVILPLLEAEAS